MMQEDEREVSSAIADHLVGDPEDVASRDGTIKLRSIVRGRGLLPPSGELEAVLVNERGERVRYVVKIEVRRVAGQ